MRILLTGATGFIGSNIARRLVENGFEVYATFRNSSVFDKCIQFKEKINWINTETCNWKEQIKVLKPDQFIHVAWGGIEAKHRNNWDIQLRNFWYSKEYLDMAKEWGIKKIIAFGSQAEYGAYNYPVSETTVPMPNDAYGAVKTLTANYTRNLFENSNADWYWIRIFSLFGEGENSGWLIPSVISKLLKNEPIPLTLCEQRYNYLYIEDFLNLFMPVVHCAENASGIYNLCHSETITIKELLIQIANIIGASENLLQFGSIPYRSGQNMLIAGDNSKFRKCFSIKNESTCGLTKGLIKTIEYYKKMEL